MDLDLDNLEGNLYSKSQLAAEFRQFARQGDTDSIKKLYGYCKKVVGTSNDYNVSRRAIAKGLLELDPEYYPDPRGELRYFLKDSTETARYYKRFDTLEFLEKLK